jgi:hypothetical protein
VQLHCPNGRVVNRGCAAFEWSDVLPGPRSAEPGAGKGRLADELDCARIRDIVSLQNRVGSRCETAHVSHEFYAQDRHSFGGGAASGLNAEFFGDWPDQAAIDDHYFYRKRPSVRVNPCIECVLPTMSTLQNEGPANTYVFFPFERSLQSRTKP